MTVVTNTGPLIALAKINQLSLLKEMFTDVFVPPAVHRELLAKSGPEALHLEQALVQFITVTATPNFSDRVKIATDHLGIGEQQAIALAHEKQSLLIIDERLGRETSRRLDLTVTGSVGVLIEAKRKSLIPAVSPLLNDIRRLGYWLSDELIATATRLAEERDF